MHNHVRTALAVSATALMITAAASTAGAASDYMGQTKSLRVAATGNAKQTWVVADANSPTVAVRYTVKGSTKTVTYPVKKWGGKGAWGSVVKALPGAATRVKVTNTKTGSSVQVKPAESDLAKYRPGSGKNPCGGDVDPCPYWR